MSLFIRGDKKKVAEYENRARKDGLEVVLYSDQRFPVKEVEIGVHARQPYKITIPLEAVIVKYLQIRKKEGVDDVPISQLEIFGSSTTIRNTVRELQAKRVLVRYPNPNIKSMSDPKMLVSLLP